MTDALLSDAADAAHGALVGLVGPEPFRVSDFLADAVLEREPGEQSGFLLRVACAAVVQHASTLAELQRLGVITAEQLRSSLTDYALLRATTNKGN